MRNAKKYRRGKLHGGTVFVYNIEISLSQSDIEIQQNKTKNHIEADAHAYIRYSHTVCTQKTRRYAYPYARCHYRKK